jgi:hypothetical protein
MDGRSRRLMIANVAARHAQTLLKFQFGNYLYLYYTADILRDEG